MPLCLYSLYKPSWCRQEQLCLLSYTGNNERQISNTATAVFEKFNVDAIINYYTNMEVVNFRLKEAHN